MPTLPFLPSVTGTSSIQIPAVVRQDLHPVGLSEDERGHVSVEGDKLVLSESAKRYTRQNPRAAVPLMIFNDGVKNNLDAIDRGLERLKTLRDNFALQATITTSVAGVVAGVAGAAGAGAMKGSLAGPKGAMIGGVMGASANLMEVGRRRWNNASTEATLEFIRDVIRAYLTAQQGKKTEEELVHDLARLEDEAQIRGPAAISAVAEYEMQLLNIGHSSAIRVMRDLQMNDVRRRIAGNRS